MRARGVAVSPVWAAWLLALVAACRQEAGPVTRVDPAELYGQLCARCHGADGKGDPEVAQALPVRDLTAPALRAQDPEALERVIMAGRNQMPAFGEALTPRKISALVGYVLKLGDK